jgi:kynureninase
MGGRTAVAGDDIPPMKTLSRDAAAALDAADPLAALRARFLLPDGVRYFAGNSLGAPPRTVAARLREVVEQEWGGGLVRAWHDWIELPSRVAARLAPLLGVEAGEVMVADSTTVDLFKLLGALLAARPQRRRLVAVEGCFPTDLYVAQGLVEPIGGELLERPLSGLAEVLPGSAALLVSHVGFRHGELHDLRALAALAREHGALLVADLSHSVGTMPLALADWGVELAVGCTYKFLGGGPGSPAFLVVARRRQEELQPPLRGWMGHADPFAFETSWRPAPGVERFACGTPSILALAALDAALAATADVDLALARRKVEGLGELLMSLVDDRLGGTVEVASPRLAAQRGAQVSLRHPEALALTQALLAAGVVGDHRPPDLLRLGLPPLTLRYADVWDAVALLGDLLHSGEHRRPPFATRRRIT